MTSYPNEYWNTKEEHEAHIQFWNSLNNQEKLNWIFSQLFCDDDGNWHKKKDLLREEE